MPALELIGGHVDALVITMLATGGSSAGDAVAAEGGDGVGEAGAGVGRNGAGGPRRGRHPGGVGDDVAGSWEESG